MEKNSKNIFFIVVLLIISISIFFRFYDLTMDPYPAKVSGAAWIDEGQFIVNARNKVLFNEWKVENNYLNPMYMSPVHNYLVFISFKLLGVSTLSLRLVPAILGLISVFFVSFMLFTKNKKAGLICLALLISNLILIANSRIATLEYLILSFMLIITGLIIHNKSISWFFAGILTPFLFFSKITSTFFILSIPLSLIIYYFIYHKKKPILDFILFSIGFLVSSTLWIIFWLIPNFNEWVFMNFSLFSYKIPFNLSKLVGMALFQLNLLALLGTIIILFFIISILFYIFSIFKRKIRHLELFLLTCFILFQFQTVFTDFPIRRMVILMPIILIMVTLFITKIKEINFKINNITYNLNQKYFLILIIFVYFIFNIAPLMVYFGTGFLHPIDSHTFLRSSQEICKYIPNNAKVYGVAANTLNLENINIKTYYPIEIYIPELEKNILRIFIDKEINYAILRENFFGYSPKSEYETFGEIREYIKENFEIIKILDGDDYYYGKNNGLPMYIYKRVEK